MSKLDLTGKRFGRLLVLREHPEPYRSPSGKSTRRWVCRCDCGNEVVVLQNALTASNGGTRSCGCLQRERAEAQAEDLTGRRFGKLLVIRREEFDHKRTNGETHGWLCHCDCGSDVVVVSRSLLTGRTRSCGCEVGRNAAARIDISGDNVLGRYDGTVISAIRPGRGSNRNSQSGHRGVYWSNRDQCWIAKIGLRGQSIWLGRFSSLAAAIKARQAAEGKYYAPLIEEFEKSRRKE